jgi:hypothetical protein
MIVEKVFTVFANRNIFLFVADRLMFKSKLQWEVTMVCDVTVSASFEHHCPNVSKWPSSSQRQCQCFFTKRVEGGLQEKQCCGSALVVMQCGYGSSILGQCGCGSVARDLMTKHLTILPLRPFPNTEERSSLFTSYFTWWLIFDCCIYATYTVKKISDISAGEGKIATFFTVYSR